MTPEVSVLVPTQRGAMWKEGQPSSSQEERPQQTPTLTEP